jgi:hypothetical protein
MSQTVRDSQPKTAGSTVEVGGKQALPPVEVDNAVNAQKPQANWNGFVAGVFSGVAKLTGMSLFTFPCTTVNADTFRAAVGHP